MKKPFWEHGSATYRSNEPSVQWARNGLSERALANGETMLTYSLDGNLKAGMEIEDLHAAFEKLGLHHWTHRVPSRSYSDDEACMVSEDSAVWLDIGKKTRSARTIFYSNSPERFVKMRDLLKASIEKTKKRGRVFVLAQQGNDLVLREFGVAGEDFIAENYRSEVVEDYRHIIKDLASKDPCGRIIILDGEPGTGKTHMVRAMLNELENATFILIPTAMVTSLGSPSFLPVLMNQRNNGPLILVLEDADEALTSRKADNISAISTLLNFSDGIFGSLLDMRIVATTNIELNSIDAAVMRPGRLCRRVYVGKLSHTQAAAIYKRIAGKDATDFTAGNFYTLGEVYKAAKGSGDGKVVAKPAKGRIGFVVQYDEKTPAEQLDAKPGDILYTDQGERVKVREDGQLEFDDDSVPRKFAAPDHPVSDEDWGDEETDPGYPDDDSDLIDEDPE